MCQSVNFGASVRFFLVLETSALFWTLGEASIDEKLEIIALLQIEKLELSQKLDDSKEAIFSLESRIDQEALERTKLHESWKSTVGELLIEHNDKVNRMEDEIKLLKRQNEAYKTSAKQASEILEEDVSKISSLKSELKLKNDQKYNLLQENEISKQK